MTNYASLRFAQLHFFWFSHRGRHTKEGKRKMCYGRGKSVGGNFQRVLHKLGGHPNGEVPGGAPLSSATAAKRTRYNNAEPYPLQTNDWRVHKLPQGLRNDELLFFIWGSPPHLVLFQDDCQDTPYGQTGAINSMAEKVTVLFFIF